MPHLRSNRRPTFAAAIACALLAAACSNGEPQKAAPNVLMVVIDTLRADHLPFYGYSEQTAPFLDRIAKQGVVFERAWATSSWTAPATASIFTGLYPNQHGVTQGMVLVNNVRATGDPTITLNRIPDAIETVPELMKSRGYRTYGIADNPNICEEEGFESGFDRFQNFPNLDATAINQTLRGWSEEIRSAPSWFVYLHYMDPHYPYQKRERWYKDPAQGELAGTFKTERELEIADLLATYDSEINYVDHHIRKAFRLLDVNEETIVFFIADHGEELKQRSDISQHDFKLYSELTRVPFFIIHPGVTRARNRVSHAVSAIDVLPTLREMIGAPPSEIDAGESLVPYYTRDELPADVRPVFSMRERMEVLGGQKIWAVIRGDKKLILTENKTGLETELYDLEADWLELENIAESDPTVVTELSAGLKEMRERALRFDPEEIQLELSEDEEQTLRDIGYVEDAD